MHRAAHIISRRYDQAVARHDPRPEIITLSPLQIRILDAIADAVGIPHIEGQPEIEIPDKLRSFEKWRKSGEYEAAVARKKEKHSA